MRSFIAIFVFVAIGAAAQEKPLSISSSPVMGKTVKGAPYSADEITESSQVLADGTRISHQTKATVYRDSEGRVRRESPDRITIFDPVAGFSYTLNTKTKTAERLTMGTLVDYKKKFYVFKSGNPSPEATAKAKAELEANIADLKANLDQLGEAVARVAKTNNPLTERIGQQVMEGLTVNGTRATETIETGAVGNDRPISVVYETWISSDLQTVIMTKHTDPRSGEETFHLANVRRGEPAAYLFTLPADYKEQ